MLHSPHETHTRNLMEVGGLKKLNLCYLWIINPYPFAFNLKNLFYFSRSITICFPIYCIRICSRSRMKNLPKMKTK